MRETWGLFLILVGIAFCWVGVHGYQGDQHSLWALPQIMDSIYGGLRNA
jgi:hypothetical protein